MNTPTNDIDPEMCYLALAACREIIAFHHQVFVGLPLCIDGKPINHLRINRAYELASTAIRKAEGH